MKNVLAIINENAGLLQDMVKMGEKGMPLNLERLSRLAAALSRQVARGNVIVAGMNRFAHSADHPTETVDVGDLILFITTLAARLISMHGPPPRIDAPGEAVTVVTNRFFLEDLVWTCLSRALSACAQDRAVSIQVEKRNQETRIHFGGLDGEALAASEPTPSSREATVARFIGAQLQTDREEGEIRIILT